MAIPFVDLSATGGWSDHGGGVFEKEIGGTRYWADIDILEPDSDAIGDYPNDWIYIAHYDRVTSTDHPMEFRMRSEGEVPIAEVLAVLEQKIGGISKRRPTLRGRANPRKELYIYPNKSSIAAAKRGLKAREKAPKSKRGGLDAMQAKAAGVGSGVLRARDIIAGKRINAYQVKAFFDRHQGNYISAIAKGLKPEESKAIQAWLIWGGDPLYRQVKRAVERDKKESRRKNPFRTQGKLPTDAAHLDSEWLTKDILDAEYDDDRYREVITSFQEGLAEMDSTGRGDEPQRTSVRPEMIRDSTPLSTGIPNLSWPVTLTLTDREWNEFMLRAWMDAAKERGMLTRQGELKKKRFWQKNPIDIVAWEDGVFKMGPEQVLNEIKYVRDVELPQLRSFGTLKEEHGAKLRLTVLKNRAWELGVEDRVPEPWKNPSKRRSARLDYSPENMSRHLMLQRKGKRKLQRAIARRKNESATSEEIESHAEGIAYGFVASHGYVGDRDSTVKQALRWYVGENWDLDIRPDGSSRWGNSEHTKIFAATLKELGNAGYSAGSQVKTHWPEWQEENPSKRRSYSKQEVLGAFERLRAKAPSHAGLQDTYERIRKTQSPAKKKRIRSLVKSLETHQEAVDELIEKAHQLWDAYYARPSKARFQAFLRHQKMMEKQHLSHPSNRLGSELENMKGAVKAARARYKIADTPRRRLKAQKPKKRSRARRNPESDIEGAKRAFDEFTEEHMAVPMMMDSLAEEYGGSFLGVGAGRRVYGFGDRVLKVYMRYGGMSSLSKHAEQNQEEWECLMKIQENPLALEVYSHAPDWKWTELERVETPSASPMAKEAVPWKVFNERFTDLAGVSFKTFEFMLGDSVGRNYDVEPPDLGSSRDEFIEASRFVKVISGRTITTDMETQGDERTIELLGNLYDLAKACNHDLSDLRSEYNWGFGSDGTLRVVDVGISKS